MTLGDFIKANRPEIDAAINRVESFVPRTAGCSCHRKGTDHYHEAKKHNDAKRRMWILNDEGLYDWARSEGVNI